MDLGWLKRNWIGHYMPLWLILLLAPCPWVAYLVERSASEHPTSVNSEATPDPSLQERHCQPNIWADLSLAILAFWLWAMTTNSHSGCSVRSSGEKKFPATRAAKDEKKREFSKILLFSILTALAYFCCLAPSLKPYNGLGAVFCAILPILVLGFPQS
jgi:hypothetical protein